MRRQPKVLLRLIKDSQGFFRGWVPAIRLASKDNSQWFSCGWLEAAKDVSAADVLPYQKYNKNIRWPTIFQRLSSCHHRSISLSTSLGLDLVVNFLYVGVGFGQIWVPRWVLCAWFAREIHDPASKVQFWQILGRSWTPKSVKNRSEIMICAWLAREIHELPELLIFWSILEAIFIKFWC